MGALGNGRRGGRSPPLMIAALIACILVLGFNYWVSSSRNLELQFTATNQSEKLQLTQNAAAAAAAAAAKVYHMTPGLKQVSIDHETKLYELEGQVRRGVAERGAAEIKKNEFQGEIQRQKEQISHIESFYKRQLEGAQNTCSQEKAILQQNISSSAKTAQELKGQLNQLNDDLGKLQKELQSCQGNINTLNNKLTYDMTHCNSQVLSQKELCEERVAAAKREVQKKMEKLIPAPGVSSQQGNAEAEAVKDERTYKTGQDGAVTVVSHTPSLSQLKGNDTSELLTNDIIPDKGSDVSVEKPPVKDLSKEEPQFVPSAATVMQDILQTEEETIRTDEVEEETSKPFKNNLTEDKEIEVMDTNEDGTQTEEADPGMAGILIGQGKVDESPIDQKVEEPEEYDADEQIVGGVDLEKRQKNKQAENIDKDMEEELADYNGDDDNEGEFEADKQAALAQI